MSSDLLGCKCRDKITGFSGVVTGVVFYLTGCNQALLAPAVDSEGKIRLAEWFDVQRLELDQASQRIVLDNSASPGFDREAPKR